MKMTADILDYYDTEAVRFLCDKYGYEPMTALRLFLNSETYRMLCDPELEMWEFSPLAMMDLWENEKITGNPRNSGYLRCECR